MADTTQKDNHQTTFYHIPEPGPLVNAQLAALQLLSKGWQAIPLVGKAPRVPGWQDAPDRLSFLKEHLQPDGNLGLVCGHKAGFSFDHGQLAMVGLDIDFTDVDASNAAKAIFAGMAIRIGMDPKFLVPVVVGWLDAVSTDYSWVKDDKSITFQVLGRSDTAGPKQFATWGIHPDTDLPYRNLKDAAGRTIFDLRPEELPRVHIASLYGELDRALRAMGWKPDLKVKHEPGDGDFDGKISEAMIANAKGLFKRALADLMSRPAGTNRGDDTYNLGLQIGMHIKLGILSMDDCVAELQAAMPDNVNAWSREFQRGVHASRGERLKAQAEREEAKANVDWAGAAGAEWEKIVERSRQSAPPPPPPGGGSWEPPPPPPGRKYASVIWTALAAALTAYILDAIKSRKSEEIKRKTTLDAIAFAESMIGAGGADADSLCELFKMQADITLTEKQKPRAQDAQLLLKTCKAGAPDMAMHAAENVTSGMDPGKALREALFKFKGAAASPTAIVEGVEVDLVDYEKLNERFARFCAPGQPPAWVSRKNGMILKLDALDILTAGEFIVYQDDEGREAFKKAYEAWRVWNGVHTYRDIVFTSKAVGDDVLNLFHGFGIEPKAGDCGLILQHIREVICSGDDDVYERFLSFEAWKLQNIGEPSRVILTVVTSKHQTGKGIYFEQIKGKILGTAFANEANTEALGGRFNDVMRGKVEVVLDETAFSGDNKVADSLKRASTAKRMNLEPKHGAKFECPVGLNFVLLSNHEHAAHIEDGDARYWVMKPSEHRAGDHTYFTALGAQISNGGCAAYLDLMLKRDVSSFVPQRDCPMDNEAKRDMATMSVKRGTVKAWLVDVTIRGSFSAAAGVGMPANDPGRPEAFNVDRLDFGGRAATTQLHKAYDDWHKLQRGRYVDSPATLQGFKLGGFGFVHAGRSRMGSSTGEKQMAWFIPTRDELAKQLGVRLEDEGDEEKQAAE